MEEWGARRWDLQCMEHCKGKLLSVEHPRSLIKVSMKPRRKSVGYGSASKPWTFKSQKKHITTLTALSLLTTSFAVELGDTCFKGTDSRNIDCLPLRVGPSSLTPTSITVGMWTDFIIPYQHPELFQRIEPVAPHAEPRSWHSGSQLRSGSYHRWSTREWSSFWDRPHRAQLWADSKQKAQARGNQMPVRWWPEVHPSSDETKVFGVVLLIFCCLCGVSRTSCDSIKPAFDHLEILGYICDIDPNWVIPFRA